MDAIELFAGMGGLGAGISRAGFNPKLIVEREKNCKDTLRANKKAKLAVARYWPASIHGDVKTVDYSPYEDKIDLVSGGPPCQPFSMGGRHQAQADTRDMFPEAVRALRETRPKAFIFENVRGLTRPSFANYFQYIQLQMAYPDHISKLGEDWADHLYRLEKHHTSKKSDTGLNYRVVVEVLNAANFGVPQRRERVFFVGFRSDLDTSWAFPRITHCQDALLWDKLHGDYFDRHTIKKSHRWLNAMQKVRADRLTEHPALSPWVTVRDALCDMPDPEKVCVDTSKWRSHVFQPNARTYPGHTGSAIDDPAKTLKAGVHGVPGGENMMCRPDGSVRYFTIREAARLQTFPDSYRISGAWTEAMRQLGNAVPVQLAEIVAKSVAEELKRV